MFSPQMFIEVDKIRCNYFCPSVSKIRTRPGNLVTWPRSHQVRQSHGNNLALLTRSNNLSAPGAKHTELCCRTDMRDTEWWLASKVRTFWEKNPVSLAQCQPGTFDGNSTRLHLRVSCKAPSAPSCTAQASCAKNWGGTECARVRGGKCCQPLLAEQDKCFSPAPAGATRLGLTETKQWMKKRPTFSLYKVVRLRGCSEGQEKREVQ